ncbi:alpha-amylase/4-alpha-glucanotransferase domain-containing protein [Nitrosospira sp. NRS527]|uniref:alpha-amylase/4-alpha-glucanotransferase domain-containing protein n=1 Tax=Nitrosospira sp. NRS527 TaxID=155925 RepID=UPI001AF0AB8D|nr:alpha-amylase/4-alpha-glucanotransferase domain-containing protein [Nitrosospira sp. NRS527]BCT67157.1 Alpha-amylase 1 [Nitrosospira sp. NRS527]
MSRSVSLLFGVHAHQPVGNFPEVLADAHLRCYQPFLQVLHRYPSFCFAVHISGWLLDYLFDHYPEDMALLRDMVMRGQVELFGAGDTEPVLAAIPNRDRIGQIQTFSDKLERKLGRRPQGAWLTERVWEATVVPALADCGIRYVIVDDYHFLCAGKTAAELDGYFTTEEDERKLDLFPISEALRYRLPFSPADEAVAYIESLAENSTTGHGNAAVYFDDIEKFGIWPETYQWVYEKGWLDNFIQGVLASPIIRPQHYRDYHAAEKTRGVVYLPTTSYMEMNEWTLPAGPANIYADLVQQAKAVGWYDGNKAFLRGGIWKNFFSRYPESNWMHKRMLGLSRRLASLPERQRSVAMKHKLYESQANDAYWHGLFGGLYLPHLRRAVFKAIVELEAMLDACAPRPTRFLEDTDLDGIEEMYLQTGKIQAVLKMNDGGIICELDSYLLTHNFGDTLRRQVEHYYRKIHQREDSPHGYSGAGIASAHERLSFKNKITAGDMVADDHARGLFVDRLNGDFITYRHEPSSADDSTCQTEVYSQYVKKSIALAGNWLQVSYLFAAEAEGVFCTEINLAMPSCDGWGGRYIYRGQIPGGFGQLLELSAMTDITLDDDVLGGSVELKVSVPAELHAQPYYSVSQSEEGFEKIMQAVTLKLQWPVMVGALVVSLAINARQNVVAGHLP